VHGGKRDANAAAAALGVDARRDAAPTTRARTVADLLTAWFEHGEPSWSVATAQGYRSRIKLIAASPMGCTALADLTTERLDRWYAALYREGLTAANIRNHHAILRRTLGQGLRWGWLASNPATLASPPRVPRRHVEALTAAEVASVIDAALTESELAGLCLRLAATTGMRRGELVGLQWNDLDGETLTVSRSITAAHDGRNERRPVRLVVGPTKTHAVRRLTLDVETVALVWRWHSACASASQALGHEVGPWIISTEPANLGPCGPDWLTRVWARARTRARLPKHWRLHDLRHWSATALISGGEDVRLVAGRLGHARPATTLDVYAHYVERVDGRAADSLAQLLTRAEVRVEQESG
jgi:integrase